MQRVDESSDVKGGENSEDLFVGVGGDLLDLEALSYYVLVGDHDLKTNQSYV